MALKLNLFVLGLFVLFALSFCEAKNSTVKVVGFIHCTDCIKNQSTSSNASLGVDVLIICKATKNESGTQGNGTVSKEGKFSVTLSSSIAQDPSSIDGCYAKLQSKSGGPCPIRSNQTATVKIVDNEEKTVMNRPTIIKFSPGTCQSAFFWPFPNLTFFASPPPPPEYSAPPQPEYSAPPPENLDFSPVSSPVEPPPENSPPAPEPSYDPPEPEFETPSPAPELSSGSPPPAPPPTYEEPIIENPSPPPQAPGPVCTGPSPAVQPAPVRTPTPPKKTPALSAPPQDSAGMSAPPSRRKPSPIPKAPPIPRLPLTPGAPRKYFNAPKSKTKPPRLA